MARPFASKQKRRHRRKPASSHSHRQLGEKDSAILAGIGKSNRLRPFLQNTNDNLAIQELYRRPIGELLLDPFAPGSIPELRLALINVYIKAADMRRLSKATRGQLSSANTALSQLARAVSKLDQTSPVPQRGFQLAVFGSPLDDTTGLHELNEFASTCRQIRMAIAPYALTLRQTIDTEKAKQTRSGERRKRLRTLVDGLADWWQSIGGSLAPTVVANRRDGAPAVVHGRHGDFLQLAVDLFCNVDEFAHTEVEAAVTNVHEARLTRTRSGSGD
jgi:hypothetical protein